MTSTLHNEIRSQLKDIKKLEDEHEIHGFLTDFIDTPEKVTPELVAIELETINASIRRDSLTRASLMSIQKSLAKSVQLA